jgi:hypothetical protein
VYPGGHNRGQLVNICLTISEDVRNSLMSKNNSSNDAIADCINNHKEHCGAFLGPYGRQKESLGCWA